MSEHPRFRVLATAAACVLLLVACTTSKPAAAPTPTASPSPALSGTLRVLAASPLKAAFDKIDAAFVAEHPGLQVTPDYQGSQALVTAIRGGAPADVFAGADMANMAALTGTGSVVTGSAQTFATNVLEIAVATGNPGAIQTLADLARPGVRVVLADPSLPAGRDAREALIRAHVTLAPKSLELQVAVVLTKVQTGDADAGIAYRSDVVTAGPAVTGVAIPAPDNVEASYAIAPLTSTPNPDVARAYIQFVLSAEGQSILRAAGFLPPAP